MKVLGVDHGEKRIGLAISDADGRLARPLQVIRHTSRTIDAARVAGIAQEQGTGAIIVGQSFDEAGQPNLAGRRSARFAEALRSQTTIPVILWDESFSTQDARQARIEMGVSRKKRSGHMDDLAAVMILQSYLEARSK
jgi:putative Holliday junction resolvase